MESCPDCGTHLTGGWVVMRSPGKSSRLPVVPVQVTEHVFIARTCPACRRSLAYPQHNWLRRGTGAPTPGRQPDQPHRHATGRRAPADPQHPVVICAPSISLRLSDGGHSWSAIHQTAQLGPTSGGRDPGPHPRQPSGPRRRNRLASKWEQRLRLDFQHPHRTLLPEGRGRRQGGRWTRR